MIPGAPSATARRVAAFRQAFDRAPSPPGGDPAADDALAADVAAGIEVDHDSPMARYLRGRTAFFDAVVAGAAAGGLHQIVNLGAGYDGRSLRYREPGVRWFEVDHPDTQADKRARLERLGIDAGDVAFVPVDFTAAPALGAALVAAGLDPSVPALVCWEGVVAYLRADDVSATAADLHGALAPGSRLAVSLSPESRADRREAFAASVAALGEPAADPITIANAVPLLAATGWRVVRPAPASAVDPAAGSSGDDPDERLRRGGLALAVALPVAAA